MLRCPICQKELSLHQNTYSCENNHSFDCSKDGYVNLLLKQSAKSFGDSIEMLQARHLFFEKDYYHPLKEKILSIIRQLPSSVLLDSGCGEGYYTNYFAKNLPSSIKFYATDISKYAIRLAAKEKTKVNYIVASNQRLPFQSTSFDCILNLFAPIDLKEYNRILKRDGYLITVTSGPKHLYELKEILYETPIENKVQIIEMNNLKLFQQIPLYFSFTLDSKELIQSLFMMTPYYYRTSPKDKEKLEDYTTLTTHADFMIQVYKKD